jgi:deazaflavin-dependent oxidoreductase (nitroreductase family)
LNRSLTSRQPKGILRALFRMPIWLYHAHLGWLLGKRFLMLTHIGRKSGHLRHTILEVVSHEEGTGAYFVAAGWKSKADWFKNIQVNDAVQFTVGTRTLPAKAQIMDPSEAGGIYLDYARRHHTSFRELSRLMMGETLEPNQADCSKMALAIPLVKLNPLQIMRGK